MNEFLLYANLILLTRLIYLWRDEALNWRENLILLLTQLLGVMILFVFNMTSLYIMILLIIVCIINMLYEHRVDLAKGYRLIFLALLLLIPNYLQSVFSGLQVRPAIESLHGYLIEHMSLFSVLQGDQFTRAGLVLFALLLLGNEANILIRAVFHHCDLEPVKQADDSTGSIDDDEYNAGRVIGFLERWLMFLVVFFSQQLNALGFIMAAKGLARMKQLEEKPFAEYMLIGTLISTLLSVITGFWILALSSD